MSELVGNLKNDYFCPFSKDKQDIKTDSNGMVEKSSQQQLAGFFSCKTPET